MKPWTVGNMHLAFQLLLKCELFLGKCIPKLF